MAMAEAAKALILNDQSYVSPYLLRPLRRLDEVERDRRAAEVAAKDARAERRQSGGGRAQERVVPIERARQG
jgi:hypothetical protein